MVEKYNISKDELNAFLFLYHDILYDFYHSKGFRYKQAFKFVKLVKQTINDCKNRNINDYITIYDDSEVLKNENELNS